MPKKATTKKAAKKTAKKSAKSSKKKAVKAGGGAGKLPASFSRMSMEKIMRLVGQNLESLDLTGDKLQQIDLNALLNSIPSADTPEEKAQELVYSAFESSDPKRRTALAKKALKLDPDNVDALLILADDPVHRIFGAVACYREAVAAGERSLGKEFFEDNVGYFWGIVETRPYMRALEKLADNLHATVAGQEGSEEINLEVLEIYRKMLRLNPGDNQGIRYKLLYRLIEMGRDDEAEKLYKQYRDEESAWWLYGRALLDYRKQEDSAESRKSLALAIKYNKHFPQYLLGHKRFPSHPPGHYGSGDANEAAYYLNDSMLAWAKTPGASNWVAKCLDKKR